MMIPSSTTDQFKLTAVDIFSGCGSVTASLKDQGFDVVLALDNDPVACETYRSNHATVPLVVQCIRKAKPAELLDALENHVQIDLAVICAPCQPFSSQNKRRVGDSRTDLVVQAVRKVGFLQPKCFLFENVAGLAGRSNQRTLDALKQALAEWGYQLSFPRKIDAADLGVPQRRLRCLMLASKEVEALQCFEQGEFPVASQSVRQAIGAIAPLVSGAADPEDSLHRARTHSKVVLDRLKHIPKDGGSRSSLPVALQLACHRKCSPTKFSDVYGRMRWDDVAPTLTTGCTDLTKGRFIHPEQDRSITLREAALLQTFPLTYRFRGGFNEIAKQIGNAVPMRMLSSILPTVKLAIGKSGSFGQDGIVGQI